jgi:hypothetical protein
LRFPSKHGLSFIRGLVVWLNQGQFSSIPVVTFVDDFHEMCDTFSKEHVHTETERSGLAPFDEAEWVWIMMISWQESVLTHRSVAESLASRVP